MVVQQTDEFDAASLPDLLPLYYKRLFPFSLFYRWLSYGSADANYFANREFSFTLKDDIYVRYNSFSNQADMETEIIRKCPYKIDIGAVYNMKPKDQKKRTTEFQAKEREIVFDIDMTDYDDVRTCCCGADICRNCWPLMQMAVEIVQLALTEDFGVSNMLWIYSGRRGVHCWVCDARERQLSSLCRSAIVDYLSVTKGGENAVKKVQLQYPVHASIQRALGVIEREAERYLVHCQDFLGTVDKVHRVMQLVVVDEQDHRQITDALLEAPDSARRWAALKLSQNQLNTNFRANRTTSATESYDQKFFFVEEILLQYCYPRLDVNVSIDLNHLLKSPFSVHPKTGRVCVPMDAKHMKDFDPWAVPTIKQLLDELDAANGAGGGDCDGAAAEANGAGDGGKARKEPVRTSLHRSVALFERFIAAVEATTRPQRRRQADATLQF